MMDVAGLFYGIGHKPNTELIAHRVVVGARELPRETAHGRARGLTSKT